MKTKTIHIAFILLTCFTLFLSNFEFTLPVQAQTYHLRSQGNLPLPSDPYEGAEPIITLDANKQIFLVEDNTNDWNLLTTAKELDAMSANDAMSMDSPPDPTNPTNDNSGGTYTNNVQPHFLFGSNDLWIQITNVDVINQQASLILHGTVPDEHYQLLSSNVSSGDGEAWTLGEYITGAEDTNQTPFSTFNIGTNSQMFFRAHHANPVMAVQVVQNAVQPNPTKGDPGQAGYFQIQSYYDLSNDMTVHYSIGGTAQAGVDYSNGYTGAVIVPASTRFTNVTVIPLYNSAAVGTKTLTMTLSQTNDYLIDPHNSSAALLIQNSAISVYIYANQDAIEPNGPPGAPAQAGQFEFVRTSDEQGLYPALTNYFTIGGTASNGVDYEFITNAISFPEGEGVVFLNINPIANPLDGVETVTLTLVPTNTYFVDTNNSSTATINVNDTTTTSGILFNQDAFETNSTTGAGQPGIFQIYRSDTLSDYPPMTVNYQISGTASNGVDYQTLSGSVTFASGATSTNIYINTLPENLFEPDETVTLTLNPNNNAYYIDSNNSNSTLVIHTSATTVSIVPRQNAIETNAATQVGQPGIFEVDRVDSFGYNRPMTVNYQIGGGTAISGVDYQLLSGTVTFAAGATSANIFVNTIEEDLIEPDETLKLTILPNGSDYYIDTNHSSATINIQTTTGFYFVATNLNGDNGIDYYARSNSLIVSYNYYGEGAPFSLAQIYTNSPTNVVVTNWSGIDNLQDEVYFTTPRLPAGALTNSAGFTNGDLFFGSGTGIGWLSADTTQSNLNWCVLTNSKVQNAQLLRGGICMDQTGTFSNNIIVVTSPSNPVLDPKGIWEVDAHAHPTLLAQITTRHLEGVTTLTNDPQQWGPWAGKIITGDEDEQYIYTIDANGVVTTNDTFQMISGGMGPEDFTVIPTNSTLYITDFESNAVRELPAHYFTKHVGDLLVTSAGEVTPGGLFIIHWDAQGSNFVTIPVPVQSDVRRIEHATFAPIQFPGFTGR